MPGPQLLATVAKRAQALYVHVFSKCHGVQADLGLKGNVIEQKTKRKRKAKETSIYFVPGTVTYVMSLNLLRSTQ